MSEVALTSDNAPEPRGPYPHLRVDGDHVWVTGQIGRDLRWRQVREAANAG